MTLRILDLSDRTNMFYWQTNRNISAQQQKDIFLTRHARLNEDLLQKKERLLRKKRALVEDSEFLRSNLARGLEAMKEVFAFFGV